MKKKIIISILVGMVVLSGAVLLLFSQGQSEPTPSNGIIYFYGDGCSHCAKVDEFVENNKIEEKISFDKKEVYNNKGNASELMGLAAKCGLPQGEIGVPFLWDGAKCYVGDTNVINFFKQKTGIQ